MRDKLPKPQKGQRQAKSQSPSPEVSANRALRLAVKSVRSLDLPPFGSSIGDLAGSGLCDSVVGHRLLKHHPIKIKGPAIRRAETISSMLAYDADGYAHSEYTSLDRNGLPYFDYRKVPQPMRGQLLMARAWLSKHFGKIPRSHAFRYPTGETAVGSRGRTSLLEKLSSPEQWTVSLEASRDAAAVCYHNHQLKRLVKDRFRAIYSADLPRKRILRAWWDGASGNRAFVVFHKMFVACCDILNVARLSTVEKDGSKDRPISMEPMWNMVAQLSFAADLRTCLRQRVGVDLESRSALHGTLVRHASKATIDFSNASNSNWLIVLEWLWPPRVYKKLLDLRTPYCEYEGQYHMYNMLAPMGCGFTFEVMTITLLALSRACCPSATVFGDDVILDAPNASAFIALASAAGWVVNKDKSFITGSFRESCGVYYDVHGDRRIVCYDLKPAKSVSDVVLLTNKVYRIIEAGQVGNELRVILWRLYCQLLESLPRVVLGDPDSHMVLDALPSGFAIVHPRVHVDRVRRGYSLMQRCIAFAYHRECRAQGTVQNRRSDTSLVGEGPSGSPAYSAFLRAGIQPKPNGEVKEYIEDVDWHSGTPLQRIPLLSVI